jgi:hypothetical protein
VDSSRRVRAAATAWRAALSVGVKSVSKVSNRHPVINRTRCIDLDGNATHRQAERPSVETPFSIDGPWPRATTSDIPVPCTHRPAPGPGTKDHRLGGRSRSPMHGVSATTTRPGGITRRIGGDRSITACQTLLTTVRTAGITTLRGGRRGACRAHAQRQLSVAHATLAATTAEKGRTRWTRWSSSTQKRPAEAATAGRGRSP